MKHERTGKFPGIMDLADGIAQRLGRFVTLPGASRTHRGAILRQEGGAGVADKIRYGQKNAADTYEWAYVPALPDAGSDMYVIWDDSESNFGYTAGGATTADTITELVTVVTHASEAGADLVWTNMPLAETELFGGVPYHRLQRDLTYATTVRIMVSSGNQAGTAGAILYPMYSTNGGAAWSSLVAANAAQASITATDTFTKSSFQNIVAGAKGDVMLAIFGAGGDGVADPKVSYCALEFTRLSGAPGAAGATGATGPAASPGGANTEVQFNDGGVFGGDAGLTYVKATDALSVAGSMTITNPNTEITGINLCSNANVHYLDVRNIRNSLHPTDRNVNIGYNSGVGGTVLLYGHLTQAMACSATAITVSLPITSSGNVTISKASAALNVVSTDAGNSAINLYDTTDGGVAIFNQDGAFRFAHLNSAGSFVANRIEVAVGGAVTIGNLSGVGVRSVNASAAGVLSPSALTGVIKQTAGVESVAVAGTDYQGADATLTALAAYNTNGILVQTAADTFTGRTIQGTATKISVTNGAGFAGDPAITIVDSVALVTPTVATSITMAAGANIVLDAAGAGTKIGTATTQKLGFYNSTPIVKGTAFTQTHSTASHTHAAVTSLAAPAGGVGAAAGGWSTAANRDLAITSINAIRTDVENVKQTLNGLIDDLQALGLIA